MEQRAWTLVIALVVCPLLVSGSAKGPAQYRLTAAQAILSAAKAINNPAWQIAFLSNTGVTESILGFFAQSDGKVYFRLNRS